MNKIYLTNCCKTGYKKHIKFFVLFIGTGIFSATTLANVYNVTNTADGNALNQLRGAILAADAAGPGPHTINVAAGTYTLTLGTIILGNNPETISIVGAGAATTIISMTTGATRDRIFLINPVGTTNSPVISISGITFQNAYLTSDAYGGGAIYSGGGTAESLTLTNCTFLNNTIPVGNGGGAAVKIDPRGNLTVDNCTFTNNISNDADGGAILFIIYGSGVGTGYGTLNVTNSTFTGNIVNNTAASTNADGGALSIRSQAGVTPFNATVTNNTFINNSADGYGGAIIAVNSANASTLQIHFNRFINNTSGFSAISSGLYISGAGGVNADNNWWGCNSNPVNAVSTSPCNQASRDVAGGPLTLTKWLQLKTTASPNPICNAGSNSTTVTASFLSNSAGEAVTAANISRLIGLPVTWTSTLGSLSAQQTTIQAAGTATATFTSNGTSGTATVNAQVDNIPASETTPARASITVNKASIAPTGISGTFTICNGSSTTLTATGGTLGTGSNYQWGTGAVVGTTPLAGQTASALTVSPATNTTYWVRIENTTAPCTGNTGGVTQVVTVNNPSAAPAGVTGTTTICNGSSTTLTATGGILGTGANYQWGTGAVMGTSSLAGQTASTLTVSPVATTTYWVRIENTTAPCTAITGGVTQAITVNQPSVAPAGISGTITICNGSSTTLTATGGTLGTGSNYQWGTGGVVGTTPLAGQTASALTVSPATNTTYWVRIENTTAPCTGTTGGVTQLVTVNQPSVAPTGISGTTSICIGGSTTLTATGGTLGTGANYQWGTGAVAGTTPLAGQTASTLTVSPGTNTSYWVRIENTTAPCTGTTGGVTKAVTVSPILMSITGDAATVPISGTSQLLFNCRIIGSVTPGTVAGNMFSSTTLTAAGANGGEPYGPRQTVMEPTTNGTATVKLYFKQSDFDAYNVYRTTNNLSYDSVPRNINDPTNYAANVRIRQYHGNNATFAVNTGTEILTPTSVVYNAAGDNGLGWWEVTVNVTSFSLFNQTSKLITTPVTIGHLRAEITGASNTVYWTTYTEQNNRKFIIERSIDGRNFNAIGEMVSAANNGNSNSVLNYQFADANPVNGKQYYRLQMIDHVGIKTYSAIVSLRRGGGKLEFADVHPVPTTGMVYFNLLGNSSNINVTVRDLNGREMVRRGMVQSSNFSVDLGNLSNGLYILEAIDLQNGEKAVFKIVKN
jgi:hypothetical protein